jgi:hypothetical protein
MSFVPVTSVDETNHHCGAVSNQAGGTKHLDKFAVVSLPGGPLIDDGVGIFGTQRSREISAEQLTPSSWVTEVNGPDVNAAWRIETVPGSRASFDIVLFAKVIDRYPCFSGNN